eukprot:SAG22_NODE_1000_length_6090_cov_9.522117_7_plen_65_part_01
MHGSNPHGDPFVTASPPPPGRCSNGLSGGKYGQATPSFAAAAALAAASATGGGGGGGGGGNGGGG